MAAGPGRVKQWKRQARWVNQNKDYFRTTEYLSSCCRALNDSRATAILPGMHTNPERRSLGRPPLPPALATIAALRLPLPCIWPNVLKSQTELCLLHALKTGAAPQQ